MKRSARVVIASTVALMGLLGGLALVRLARAPAAGTISTPYASNNVSSAASLVSFQGTYFQLAYPSTFTARAVQTPRPPFLERHEFIASQAQAGDIVIQIEALPSGNLADDGAYHFRHVTPSRFHETVQTLNGMVVHNLVDTSPTAGFATVAFFTHNGLLASLALTGSSPNDATSLQALYDALLASWQWH